MTSASPASASDGSGPHRFRLWPDEYEKLRDEARGVVKTTVEALASTLTRADGPKLSRAEQLKEDRDRLAGFFEKPSPEGENRDIAGRHCRVFLPDQDAGASVLYLHFHGGGMTGGLPEMNDSSNLEISRRHGIPVVSASYRLAPEDPYPAAVDDGLAVARWLLDNAEKPVAEGGFGARRIIIGGESAGGYLAAAVMLRIRDELGAIDRVAGANLVYGVHDWGQSPSHRGLRLTDGPDLLTPDGIATFTEAYLPGRTDAERRDPAVSPAFADLRGLPPALLSVGTSDHLVDDTLLLATRWAAAGGDVELFVAPELPHGGDVLFPCQISRHWAERTTEWFDRIIGA